MELMDAWTKFFQTGNVLDYLKYSAIRDSRQYLNDEKTNSDNTNSFPDDNSMKS